MNDVEIFETIQKFLKHPPVVIWGSGATVPYEIPSQEELKTVLTNNGINIDSEKNLEKEIDKIEDSNKNKAKEVIFEEILAKDILCLQKAIKDNNLLQPIRSMINYFRAPFPEVVNIVTSNYDRVLEYALAQENIPYTDGFGRDILSRFNDKSFFDSKKEIVHLIKVHGSLNWMLDNELSPFCLPSEYKEILKVENISKSLIFPGGNKYKEAFGEPYRDLIRLSDKYINDAKSFFVVGFGFNDDHVTPKMDKKIQKGVPIVVITKQATDSCKKKLCESINHCLLQEEEENKTQVIISRKKGERHQEKIEGAFWNLEGFMEILK